MDALNSSSFEYMTMSIEKISMHSIVNVFHISLKDIVRTGFKRKKKERKKNVNMNRKE